VARAINHYRLYGEGASIVSGHTVFDLGLSRQLRRGAEFNLTLDNLTNRDYYETQNYFESRLPREDAIWRIHGTPGYPLTAAAGLPIEGEIKQFGPRMNADEHG
jgi:outer membrane receptor protein involved in Fe transport